MFLFLIFLPVLISNVFSCPEECSCENTEDKNHTIVCSSIGWTRIEHKLNTKLERIDFTNNNISRLDQEFRGLVLLSSLELQYNAISFVNIDTFKDLHNLIYLDLSFNRITNISVQTFTYNIKLKKLYLKQNPILFPQNTPWFSSKSLTYLDISFCNKDYYIPSIAFTQVTEIETLKIEGFSEVSQTTFSHLIKLKDIYVQKSSNDCYRKLLSELLYTSNIKIHVLANDEAIDSLICVVNNDLQIETVTMSEMESTQKIVAVNAEFSVIEDDKMEPKIQSSTIKTSSIDLFTLILGLVFSASILVICVATYVAWMQCNKRKIKKKERRKLPTPEIVRKGQRLAEPEYDYPVLRSPEYQVIQNGGVYANEERMELYLQPGQHPDIILSSSIPDQHCQNIEEMHRFIHPNIQENDQNFNGDNIHFQQNILRNIHNTNDLNDNIEQCAPKNDPNIGENTYYLQPRRNEYLEVDHYVHQGKHNTQNSENGYIQHKIHENNPDYEETGFNQPRRHGNIQGVEETGYFILQNRRKLDQKLEDSDRYFQQSAHGQYLEMTRGFIRESRPENDKNFEKDIYIQQSRQNGSRNSKEYMGGYMHQSKNGLQTSKVHALVHRGSPENYQEFRGQVCHSKQKMHRDSHHTKPVYQETTEPIPNCNRANYNRESGRLSNQVK